MDNQTIKHLRISIRRTRAKLRKHISDTFHVPGVVNIMIDYICWNRHMLENINIREGNVYFTARRMTDGLMLYVDTPSHGDFYSNTRYMNPKDGIWALLKKMGNSDGWDWGYDLLMQRLAQSE